MSDHNYFFNMAFSELNKPDSPIGLFGLGVAILAVAEEQQRTADAQERIATAQEQIAELLGHITIKYVDGRVKTDEPSLEDILISMEKLQNSKGDSKTWLTKRK